mgnify:CR=1 FL=1
MVEEKLSFITLDNQEEEKNTYKNLIDTRYTTNNQIATKLK